MQRESGILEQALEPERGRIDGVALGWVVRGGGGAEVLVDWPSNPTDGPVAAMSTVAVGSEDADRDVALAFLGGDPGRPVVLGFIHLPEPLELEIGAGPAASTPLVGAEGDREPRASGSEPVGRGDQPGPSRAPELESDGERLVLTAEREIVLRCGRASLTLTRAGKVLIRGAYVLSRSSGVNRIKGGSVQIN